MPWIGPAIGAAAGLLGGGSSQGGTTTQKNEPWSAAQPWLQNNLQTGQNLQSYYQRNPFNSQQQAAYGNLASSTDFMNRLTPGLLQQFGQQGGFDRSNPHARPAPFSFLAPQGQGYGGQMQPSSGSLGFGNMNTAQNPFANGGMPPPAAPAPAAPAPYNPFTLYAGNGESGGAL